MHDPETQLRQYAGWVGDQRPPVDPAELRARAEQVTPIDLVVRPGRNGQRYWLAAAAVLAVASLSTVWVATRTDDRSVTGGVGTTDTTAAPAPELRGAPAPMLRPDGDDPLVTCGDSRGEPFRRSALRNPTGAERDPDPSSEPLRQYLEMKRLAGSVAPPLVPGLPGETWRRLDVTDSRVVFGAGEPPMMSFVVAVREGDAWRLDDGAGGGGSCTLHLAPPDGHQWAAWTVAPDSRPQPGDRSLALSVSLAGWPCGEPLRPDEVVGPDVVETADSVTIRVAVRRPVMAPMDQLRCRREPQDEGPPLLFTVPLVDPLADRAVFDGEPLEPRLVNLAPPPRPRADPSPEVRLGDGTTQHSLLVLGNCSPGGDPARCRAPAATAELRMRTEDGRLSATGRLSEVGTATLVLPDEPVAVTVVWPDHWCATATVPRTTAGSEVTGCTSLVDAHTIVRGKVSNRPPAGRAVEFIHSSSGRAVQQSIAADGTYEVVIEPGKWVVYLRGEATDACSTQALGIRSVAGEAPITYDLTCPTTG